MLMLDYKELNWWYWLASACFLTAGVSGYQIGFHLVIGLSAIQVVHFALRENSLTSFAVQVRFAYLVLMLICLLEPMQWLYWLPFAGTWARCLVGYCLLARILSLMPWNSREPFTRQRLITTFFSRPVRGSIMQGFYVKPAGAQIGMG